MNRRRSSRIFSLHCVFKDFLHQEISVIISSRDPIQGRLARAALDWSIAGLAPAASVKTPLIDLRHRASRLSTVERLRSVMEAAGFIPETGCAVGVRLHEPGLRKKTKSLKSQQTTELTRWSLAVGLFRLVAAIRTRERARWPFDSTPCSSFQTRISPAWSALPMRWPREPPMKPRRPGRCLDVISKFMSSSERKSTIAPSRDADHEIHGATSHST
jgi:hypothetical protein